MCVATATCLGQSYANVMTFPSCTHSPMASGRKQREKRLNWLHLHRESKRSIWDQDQGEMTQKRHSRKGIYEDERKGRLVRSESAQSRQRQGRWGLPWPLTLVQFAQSMGRPTGNLAWGSGSCNRKKLSDMVPYPYLQLPWLLLFTFLSVLVSLLICLSRLLEAMSYSSSNHSV